MFFVGRKIGTLLQRPFFHIQFRIKSIGFKMSMYTGEIDSVAEAHRLCIHFCTTANEISLEPVAFAFFNTFFQRGSKLHIFVIRLQSVLPGNDNVMSTHQRFIAQCFKCFSSHHHRHSPGCVFKKKTSDQWAGATTTGCFSQ